ncbi:MAG: hypothetical protein ABIK15_00905 [Pseudomonadota bacterium]
MKNNFCLFERFSKLSIAITLLAFSTILAISGFTVFPFFGVLIAVPFFLVSVYFFRAHMSEACELE